MFVNLLIFLTEKKETEWWMRRLVTRIGIFPLSFDIDKDIDGKCYYFEYKTETATNKNKQTDLFKFTGLEFHFDYIFCI